MIEVAVLNGHYVQNIILAESVEVAEQLTGKSCAIAGDAKIGYLWNEELQRYLPARPFASWSWDDELQEWAPPAQKPEDGAEYEWDENAQSWTEFVPPQPVFEVPIENPAPQEEPSA